MSRSFAPEVHTNASGEPNWASNAMRFKTEEEAQLWVDDLERRWLLVMGKRVVESDDPPNYEIDMSTGRMRRLDDAGTELGTEEVAR